MKYFKLLIIVFSLIPIIGCKTLNVGKQSANNTPTEETKNKANNSDKDKDNVIAINSDTFSIVVPKDISETGSHIKGVKFFKFEKQTSNKKKLAMFSFMSKGSKKFATGSHKFDAASSILKSSFCNVYQAKTSKNRYSSCEIYLSNVKIDELDDRYQVGITPYQLEKRQGRDPMFMSIDFLGIDTEKFLSSLANQSIYYSEEVTSDYPAASIKGDFDRTFKRVQFKSGARISDELKKYKYIYSIDLDDNVNVIVAAAFYPYKNGSIAKILVKPTRKAEKGIRSIDWFKIKADISTLLRGAIS